MIVHNMHEGPVRGAENKLFTRILGFSYFFIVLYPPD